MLNLGRDVRAAWRRLLATPTFTIFSVLTLALGIGATTAIYSAVHAFIGPPPGVADIDGLVNIAHSDGSSVPMIGLSYGDFEDLQARQTVFEGLAGWRFFRQAFSANGQADTAFGEAVSGDYFRVLGVAAEIGRTIQPVDDTAGAAPVVVISHGVWQRVFGGAPDVIGRVIKMNGVGVEIVGVAPRVFAGLFNNGLIPSAMWIPMASVAYTAGPGTGMDLNRDDRSNRWVLVKARLKPGRSLEAARAEVTGIAHQLDLAYPLGRDLDPRYRMPWAIGRPWIVRPTRDVMINEGASRIVAPVAATFMVAVGLVLLVACTNLANLMLARGSGRRAEMAVRLTLGASRWRLVRAAFAECVLLALGGGLVGVGLARWLFVAVTQDFSVGNGATVHLSLRLDPAVLSVSAASTLLVLVVAGLVPALQSTRGDLRSALSSGGSQAALPRWRGRRFLISMQVMVSVLLVSVAALALAQLRSEGRPDTGMDLEHLALVQVDFATQKYEPGRARQIVAAVLGQMANRPGVIAVSASSGLPIGLGTPGVQVGTFAELLASTPGIFRTLGVTITHGRAFDERDTTAAGPVAIVSESIAKKVFGRVDVVGQPLPFKRRQWAGEAEPAQRTLTIVGVTSDTDAGGAGRRDGGVVYVPLDQQYEGNLVLAVRTDGDPAPLVGALRQAVASVDREAAITQAGTGLDIAAPSNLFVQLTAGVSGVLGTFALVLALAGLYGVLSHVVARRTREIGLRIALGAARRDIIRMVLRDGLHPVASGIVAGLLIGAIVRMTLRPFFVRLLPAVDPFVLTIVPLLMILAAFVACYLPARKAARVDPNVALRDA
jgi:predicted permease